MHSIIRNAAMSEGFTPDDIAALDELLDRIYLRAFPLAWLDDRARNILAFALLEGIRAGLCEPGELEAYALRVLPSLRNADT